jgi:hypothetical protein
MRKPFFFEKRTKKLLFPKRPRCRNARATQQKFLLLFSKRSASFLPFS